MAFNNIPPNGFPALPDVEDLEAVKKDVTDLNAQKANQITIAPFFNSESSYNVGDLVYYNGLSYRCTNAHEGEWDADDFASTTIANELDTLKTGLIKALTTTIELTPDSNGDATSATMSSLHPNKNILAVIINFNYKTSYGEHHARNIWYYPPNDTIIIRGDEIKSQGITVFYTILYTD